MEYKTIIELIEKPVSGEWGIDPSGGQVIKVLRNTNFSNDGSLNLKNVVEREIPISKIAQKKLTYGDILIEKSGGSPAQPVGRVVFFNQREGEYLFSNFTSSLRPKNGIFPKYLFYLLYGNHLFKKTLSYQNKTTGILNLQLDRYLKETSIPIISFTDQQRIATILDHADSIRHKNKQILEKYNELAQSVFYEMFGDPVRNSLGWPAFEFGDIVIDIIGGVSVGGEDRELNNGELGVLKISSVTSGIFKSEEFKASGLLKNKRKVIHPMKGDLLFSRANTREMVGAICIVDRDYKNLFLPDKLWKIGLKQDKAKKWFIKFLLSHEGFRGNLRRVATGTSGSMLNISKAKLCRLCIPIPTLSIQVDFEAIMDRIEIQKELTRKSLQKSEELFQSLLQRAFKGDL